MSTLRGGSILLLTLVLAAAGLATAQDDPTVNESEFDTTAPEADETYLNETESNTSDPTLEEGDFDTTAPAPDESYLGSDTASNPDDPTLEGDDFDTAVPPADDAYLDEGGATGGSSGRGVPAAGLAATLAALAALVALRRR